MVLLEGDRATLRRFAVRRAAVTLQLTLVLLLLAGTGFGVTTIVFSLLFSSLTYVGFTARGTRGLRIPATHPSARHPGAA